MDMNRMTVSGVQYAKNKSGQFVAVMPMTTADLVYYDIDSEKTILDFINEKTQGMYRLKGYINNTANLPTENAIGDMYYVMDGGTIDTGIQITVAPVTYFDIPGYDNTIRAQFTFEGTSPVTSTSDVLNFYDENRNLIGSSNSSWVSEFSIDTSASPMTFILGVYTDTGYDNIYTKIKYVQIQGHEFLDTAVGDLKNVIKVVGENGSVIWTGEYWDVITAEPVDLGNFYTKLDTYSKTEVTNKISASQEHVLTYLETDYYNKSEIDAKFGTINSDINTINGIALSIIG